MIRAYCTYFDHRYLARGLAMIRSLVRFVPGARVWVLCLDDKAHEVLAQMREPGIELVRLAELERNDPALTKARADGRNLIEYYFTCTAPLIRDVMRRSGADMVTYLDGDLWFFADPEPIYQEMGEDSVLIIPHRFPEAQRDREKYGRFNVGWISFRLDSRGTACLDWWRARTLEWCRDHVDEASERFADQRYLDQFPRLFPGVHILRHAGANLAPWNLATHALTSDGGAVMVDGRDRLIFFHFHGIKRLSLRRFLTLDQTYGAKRSRLVRRAIYAPYLRSLIATEAELSPALRMRESVRAAHSSGPAGTLHAMLRFLIALLRGRTVAP